MGDPQMTLREEDVRRIVDYARPWLRDLVTETTRKQSERDTALLERMVRIEEELKAQRELMAEKFEASDRRFESMQVTMDRRFETMQAAMDQRFDAMDKRFDSTLAAMDKRFDSTQSAMDKRFDSTQAAMDKRFDAVATRFADVNARFDDVNARFDDVNARFDDVNARFEDSQESLRRTQWMIGIGFVMITVADTVFGVLA